MKTCLPQKDGLIGREERQLHLRERRGHYQYDDSTLAPFLVVKELPSSEEFSVKYGQHLITSRTSFELRALHLV
jgi:hypothetical protein